MLENFLIDDIFKIVLLLFSAIFKTKHLVEIIINSIAMKNPQNCNLYFYTKSQLYKNENCMFNVSF